jgi:hypothetical protein
MERLPQIGQGRGEEIRIEEAGAIAERICNHRGAI